ncbi:MAG: hypothetical protein Q9225_007113 [Loekoesia sp. 1 TL-2023]
MAKEAELYTKLFWDLGPVSVQNFSTSYAGIFYAAGTGLNDPVCHEPLGPSYLFPMGFQTYNVPVFGQLFKLRQSQAEHHIQPVHVMLEGYSLKAVKVVDPASTAFAHRDDNILIGFLPKWPNDSGPDREAEDWAKQARALVQSGIVPPHPLSTYVSYAHGDKPLEAIYGYMPWRLEKQWRLKREYDLDFQIRFYNLVQ